jgi:tetratricopeptide (TPR) repeat protein
VELRLADERAQAGDTAGAVQVLRAMMARPAPHEALLEAIRQATRLGAPALADTALGVLVAKDSADVEALDLAARVAEELGDRDRALKLARRAAALDAAGPEPFLQILRLAALTPDTAKLYLRRALWRGVDRLQSEELMAAAAVQAGSSPRSLARARAISQRREASSATVRTLLDTVVFHTDWGEGELVQLRGAYPSSQLLDRYTADLAAAHGRSAEALDLYDRLLARSPADAALHRARASVLARSGLDGQAKAAWARVLEMEPESEDAFRALVRLHQADATLPQLLAQIRRIEVRVPDSPALVRREVEILQRLGRIEEAQAVAAKARAGDGT